MTAEKIRHHAEELQKQGITIIKGFIAKPDACALRSELNLLASKRFALTRHAASIRLSASRRVSFDIPDAANTLHSRNLLEDAIDISRVLDLSIPTELEPNFKLTMLSAACDHDSKELRLHSDNIDLCSFGMFRAILYLSDSDTNSGAFRYALGSHATKHDCSHYHNSSNHDFDIHECTGNAGDLVLFNGYGIHGRNPCVKSRHSISFEFLPEVMAKRNNSVSILQGRLTEKVIENIRLFSIPLNQESGKLQDALDGKFWCPTTQYDRKRPIFIEGVRFHLIASFITIISRLIPLQIQDNLKSALSKLR